MGKCSNCGSRYFKMVEGKRVCAECGEPSPNQSPLGRKAVREHEDKATRDHKDKGQPVRKPAKKSKRRAKK